MRRLGYSLFKALDVVGGGGGVERSQLFAVMGDNNTNILVPGTVHTKYLYFDFLDNRSRLFFQLVSLQPSQTLTSPQTASATRSRLLFFWYLTSWSLGVTLRETLGMLCSIKRDDILIDTNDFAWFTVLLVLCNPVELVLGSALGGKVIKSSEQFKNVSNFSFSGHLQGNDRQNKIMEHGIISIGIRFP